MTRDTRQAISPVVVVDDHDVIHAGVHTWCAAAQPPIHLKGSYFTSEAFLHDYPTATTDIGVVLLDLELSSRRPHFEAVERIAEAGHRIIVYSHLEDNEIILHCLDLGALTYLVKTEGRQHLIEAIHAAQTDTPYVGPRMAAALANDATVGRPQLAVREREVLIAWFQTESKELVARSMFIEPTTVRTHLQRIRAKYAAVGRPARTKAALVARAIQDGIISAEDL